MAQFKVKLLDLQKQYELLEEEIKDALERVLKSGRFILGNEVSAFEKEIKKYLGLDDRFDAIGVASGSDALLLSLMAINTKPGDEVITTPFTFFATAGAIARLNAKPVFVDITLNDFNIDVSKIEEKITNRTKAIITVDLFGQPSNLIELRKIADKHNLFLIDDACQAIGSEISHKKVGAIADFTTFSFFPTKNLGGYGDGGLVITKNKTFGERIRKLRVHGASKKYFHEEVGMNSRLDELQAAILRVKLKYLDQWIEQRRKNAEFYNNALKDLVRVPIEISNRKHTYHQYSILTERRDELKSYLEKYGIQTAIYYPLPLHLQKCFEYLGYKKGDFPNSEYASDYILSLPIHENLSIQELEYVIEVIKKFFD